MTPPLRSIDDPHFRHLVESWIETHDDVLVVIRYSHAGGIRDYVVLTSVDTFHALRTQLPPRAEVIVFRDQPLPLRGVADPTLLQDLLDLISDTDEWLVVRLTAMDPHTITALEGETHAAARHDVPAFFGFLVRAGRMPLWHQADHDGMISARVPLPDGTLAPGVF